MLRYSIALTLTLRIPRPKQSFWTSLHRIKIANTARISRTRSDILRFACDLGKQMPNISTNRLPEFLKFTSAICRRPPLIFLKGAAETDSTALGSE
jgi:hypothetical protein